MPSSKHKPKLGAATKTGLGPKEHFKAGNEHFDRGEYGEAVKKYSVALRLDKGHEDAYFNMGLALNELGDYARAKKVFTSLRRRYPDDPEINTNLGVAHHGLGELEDAEKHYLSATEHGRDKQLLAATHHNLAELSEAKGDSREALRRIERAKELLPENPHIRKEYAKALTRARRYADAEKELALLLEENPEDAELHYEFARLRSRMGGRREATEHYKEAIKRGIEPNLDGLGSHPSDGYLADAYRELGQLDKAVSIYQLVKKKIPENIYPSLGLARASLMAGDLDGAKKHLADVFEEDPDNPLAHSNMGKLNLGLGELKKAADHFRRAEKAYIHRTDTANPELSIVYGNLGDIHAQKGELKKAIAMYKKALANHPEPATLHRKIASFYAKRRQYSRAAESMEDVLYNHPHSFIPEDHKALGTYLLRSKSPSEALPHLVRAVKGLPGDADSNLALGRAYFDLGRYVDAQYSLERAHELSPTRETKKLLKKNQKLLEVSPLTERHVN